MKEVYESADITKYNKLKYTLSKNLAIAAGGLALSFNMLVYNVITTVDLSEKLRASNMTEQAMNEICLPELDRLNNIQNTAFGLGAASGTYLLLGMGIPLAGYALKKKSLEESFV